MSKNNVKETVGTGAPMPQGPYSPGVRAGDFIFLSGQGPIDPTTNELVEGDVRSQTLIVLSNLLHVLESCGGRKEQVVKSGVFLLDAADFTAMNETYAQFFGQHRPARTTVQTGFVVPGMKVEIDWVAYVPIHE